MSSNSIDSHSLRPRVQELIDAHARSISSQNGGPALLEFNSTYDQETIYDITSKVEEAMGQRSFNKGIIKKTFNILIEGLQNSFFHGEFIKDRAKYLGLSLHPLEDGLDILIIGVTKKAPLEKVKGLVANLNQMDKVELKKHYMEVMEHGSISEKGGAGLGLITMVMKSKNGMQIKGQDLDNDSVLIESHLVV